MLPAKKELLLLPLLLRIPILVFPWLPKIFPFSPAVPFHIPANSFAPFMQSNQATKPVSGDRPNLYCHWSAFQTYFFIRRGKMILFYYQELKQNIKQLQIHYIFIDKTSTAAQETLTTKPNTPWKQEKQRQSRNKT